MRASCAVRSVSIVLRLSISRLVLKILLTGENEFLNYASKMLPEFAFSLVQKTVSSFYSQKKTFLGENLSSVLSFLIKVKLTKNY